MEPTLRDLDETSIVQLCAGQVIVDVKSCVRELVDNALDAGSREIKVRIVDDGATMIEVADDGYGMSREELRVACSRHTTSKIRTFDDLLGTLPSLGFRGEALNALANLSKVTIISRSRSSCAAFRMAFDASGQPSAHSSDDASHENRPVGTTVIAEQLFWSLPVRQRELQRTAKIQLTAVLHLLTAYAVIHSHVRFVLITQSKRSPVPKTLLCTDGGSRKSLRDSVRSLFGHATVDTMLDLDVVAPGEHPSWRVTGLLVPPWQCHQKQKRLAFVFVNKRYVVSGLSKLLFGLSTLYHALSSGKPTPQYVFHIEVASDAVDFNVTPDKQTVFLRNLPDVAKLVLAHIERLLQSYVPNIEKMRPAQPLEQSEPLSQGGGTKNEAKPPSECQRTDPAGEAESPPVKRYRVSVYEPDVTTSVSVKKEFEAEPLGSSVRVWEYPQDLRVDAVCSAYDHDAAGRNPDAPGISGHKRVSISPHSSSHIEDPTSNLCDGEMLNHGRTADQQKDRLPTATPVEVIERQDEPCPRDAFGGQYSQTSRSNGVSPERNDPSCATLVEQYRRHGEECRFDSKTAWNDSHCRRMVRIQRKPFGVVHLPSSAPLANEETVNLAKYCPVFEVVSTETLDLDRLGLDAAISGSFASNATAVRFPKRFFSAIRVIGQFNRGFIIGALSTINAVKEKTYEIFVIDQHATDEKFKYEALCKESYNTTSQRLVSPIRLDVSPAEKQVVIDHLRLFRLNGFDIAESDVTSSIPQSTEISSRQERSETLWERAEESSVPSTSCMQLTISSLPQYGSQTLAADDVFELIGLIRDNGNLLDNCQCASDVSLLRPSKVRAILASKACRSAVMIGDALTKSQMAAIVQRMATMDQPWNCPHGRPTMRHLLTLQETPRAVR